MIEQRQLDLLDEDRKLVFQGLSDEHQEVLRMPEPDSGILEGSTNIKISSPDAQRLAKSKLAGDEKAIQDIHTNVIKFVKQNSIVDGAKDL